MSARSRFVVVAGTGIAAVLLVAAVAGWLGRRSPDRPAIVSTQPAPVRDLDRVVLQLKWYHQFQFAGYYAAIEKGYFRDAGLDVVLKEATPSTDPTQAVVTGQADYGISGSDLLIRHAHGQPIVAVGAIFQHSATMVMARRDSGISTAQDLYRKRVMVEPAVGPEITAMLRNEGVDDSRVQSLPHSWNINDLIEGRVDAISCYSTNEPFLMQQRGIPANLIAPLKYGIDFYGDCLFTSQKEAAEHPERVAAFMEASRRGWIYAMSHRQEMAELIIARYNARKSREHLLFEAAAMETLIVPDLVEIGHMNPWRWQHIGDQYVRLGLLKPDYALKGFLFAPPQPWLQRHLQPLAYVGSSAIVAGLLVVSSLMLFNRRLRRAVAKQTAMLRDSEQQLRRAVVDAPFPVMIHAEDGRIVMASNTWYEITGYRSEQIATITQWTELAHGPHAKAVQAHLGTLYAASGRSVGGEYEVITAEGETRVWDLCSAPLGRGPDGQRTVISMAVDITARRRAEQASREASRRYQTLFNNANDAVLLSKSGEDGMPGPFIEVNDVACERLGYDRAEFLRMTPLDLDAAGEHAEFAAHAKELVGRGRAVWEGACVTKDGRRIPMEISASLVDLSGRPTVMAIMRDLTDRKQAEAAIAESEQRYRSLVESMDEGLALCEMIYDDVGRPVDFRHLQVNAAFGRLTGLAVQQVVGRRAKELLPGLEPVWFEFYDRVLRTGCSERIVKEVKSLGRYLEVNAYRPAPGRFAAIVTDVTVRRQAELAMAAAKAAAEEASRAKDRLLATVSHELRTPLTPILLRLSMLQEDRRVPAMLHEPLAVMRQSVELENRLIDGLLDLTRMTQGRVHLHPEVVDAHDLLERALATSAEDADGPRLVIRRELKAAKSLVRVDPTRMQQVCWNIIKNAMQYTPPGGTLTLESCNTDEQTLELRFADTGIGIAPEFLPRVFDAFERGPNMGRFRPSGLGLGMAIARSLTQQLGGSIDVASDGPGKGATFTLRLPLASATEVNKPVRPAEPRPDSTVRPLRVLLVEDDAATCDALADVIRTMGHTVQTATTVKQTLVVAETHPFDLLVSDIGLPDGSGLDVMRWFRQHRPIPGIAVSGYGSDEDMKRSLDAGFVTHIVKPIPVSTLRWAMSEAARSVRPT